MADMPILMHDGVSVAITVHDAAILQVRTCLQNQATIVTAQ